MPTRRDLFALGAGLPLLLAGVRTGAAADLAAVNEDIALNHAAPRYRAFAVFADSLEGALGGLPDGSTDIPAAQDAFHTAMDGWQDVQHLRLGPSQLDAREFRIEYWPDKRNRVDRQLAEALEEQREELLDPAYLASASVALQGFPVLERLLFVDPVAAGSYGAQLAAAVGTNLASIAGELSAAWSPGSRLMADMLEPGSSETAYADADQVAGHVLTAIATQLEFVAQRKLMGPLGESVEKARPRLAESWRSARSLRNIRINTDALGDIFSGGDGRFAAALADSGAAEAARGVTDRIAASAEALAPMPDALEPLVADPAAREILVPAATNLDDARRLLVSSGAPVLGLNLGFNSLDGD